MIGNMKQSNIGVMVVMVAALAASIQGIVAPDCVLADSSVFAETNDQPSSIMLETTAPSQPPLAVPSAPASSADVRDIPSISGRYAVGGKTLLPYIGAGFAGGYNSEFNRSLSGAPPSQSEFGLRSQFGQSISPNELQLGVRIPF